MVHFTRTIQKRGTCLKAPEHKRIQEYFRVAEKSSMSDLCHYCVWYKSKFIKQYPQKPYCGRGMSMDYYRTFGIQKVTLVPEKIFFCYNKEPQRNYLRNQTEPTLIFIKYFLCYP